VTRLRPGDEVYADVTTGGFAEYSCIPEDLVERKPANLSFEQAAAVPLAALTALPGLRDHARVQAGQKVLIIGASGGVGTFAVQLAKWLGAEVTGVCSTRLGSFLERSSREDLALLRELIEAGTVTPVIDRTYPLCEVPKAIRYLETGRARGKVVITV
jgi:NADPH:quinone reductase-like Zn-dependent oxidoreductase